MTRVVVWRIKKVGCEFQKSQVVVIVAVIECPDEGTYIDEFRVRTMHLCQCDSSGCDASLANPSMQSCWQYLDRFVHRLGNLPISMLVRPTHIKSSPCPRSQPTNLSSSISFSECLLRSSNPASNSPPPLKLSSQVRSSPSQTSAQNHGLLLSVRIPSTKRTVQNLILSSPGLNSSCSRRRDKRGPPHNLRFRRDILLW